MNSENGQRHSTDGTDKKETTSWFFHALAVALVLVGLAVAVAGVAGTAAAQTTTAPDCSTVGYNGDGTTTSPFEVSNVSQLQCINQDLNANYTLISDIDASGTPSWNGGAGFEPIGSTTNEFKGTVEGGGFVIDGLFIDRPTTDEVGLISVNEGVLTNITLTNADITGSRAVGTLVGRNDNAGVTGGNVGDPGTILNSSAQGAVSASDVRAGGLVGSTIGTTIRRSSADVTVDYTGNAFSAAIGGLVGDSGAEIRNSYATGDVNAPDGRRIGGLVGINGNDVNIERSYATGNVTGRDVVGGLVGFHDGVFDDTSLITRSYAAGNVTATGTESVAGGLVASTDAEASVASDAYWDTEATGQSSSDGGSPLVTAEMKGEPAKTNMSFDFTNTWDVLTGDRISYPFLRGNRQEPAPGLMFTVPFFDVEITGTNSPVEEGDILQVTADVTNLGEPDTQTVSLTDTDFGGGVQDTSTLTLNRDETGSVTLEWQTQTGDTGTGDVTVASENDTAASEVRVLSDACPITLGTPGESFELENDVSSDATCVSITASDVTFDGNGHNVTGIPDVDPGSAGILVNGTGKGGIEGVTVKNVTVQDWDAGTSASTATGIKYENVTRGVARNVALLENNFALEIFDSPDTTFNESEVTGPGLDIQESSGVRVADNSFDGSSIAVLGFDTPRLEIVDNEIIEDDGGPISLDTADGVRIERNEIRGGFGSAVSITTTAENAVIRDNVITGVGQGVSVTGADNGNVVNNTVTGIRFSRGIGLFDSKGLTVSENNASNNDGEGIFLENVSDSVFSDNDVIDNNDGIFVTFDSDNNTIRRNNASGSTSFDGISLSSSSENRIINNTAVGNEDSGVFLTSGSSNNTVMGNTLEDNNFNGVNVFDNADDNLVKRNYINRSGSNGVLVQASVNNTVRDNVAKNSETFDGVILLNEEDSKVINNTVTGNAGDGVNLDGAVDALVRNNTARDNTQGIGLTDEFSGFSSVDNEIVDNTVVNNELEGILLERGSVNNNIVDTVAHGNGDWVLAVRDDSNATVENLDIGESVAPNTTLSFDAKNVSLGSVGGSEVPTPGSPDGQKSVRRYFEAESTVSGTTATTTTTRRNGKKNGVPKGMGPHGNKTDSGSGDTTEPETSIRTNSITRTQVSPSATEDGLTNLELRYKGGDVAGVDATTLALWRFNATVGEWRELDDSGVDTSRQVVTADITNFSTFGAFGEEGQAGGVRGGGGDCVDRRDLGRGQESQECPNDRGISRGESRDELDRETDRRSDTRRRDRGRRNRGR